MARVDSQAVAGAGDRRRVSRLALASAILFLLPALYAWGREEPAPHRTAMMPAGVAASFSDDAYLRAADLHPQTAPVSHAVASKPAAAAPVRTPVKHDRYYCEFLAQAMIGNVTPEQAERRQQASGAIVGALGGAFVGALFGSTREHSSGSAALGAGAGLLAGVSMGSSSGRRASDDLRSRYDWAYSWCMNQKDEAAP